MAAAALITSEQCGDSVMQLSDVGAHRSRQLFTSSVGVPVLGAAPVGTADPSCNQHFLLCADMDVMSCRPSVAPLEEICGAVA